MVSDWWIGWGWILIFFFPLLFFDIVIWRDVLIIFGSFNFWFIWTIVWSSRGRWVLLWGIGLFKRLFLGFKGSVVIFGGDRTPIHLVRKAFDTLSRGFTGRRLFCWGSWFLWGWKGRNCLIGCCVSFCRAEVVCWWAIADVAFLWSWAGAIEVCFWVLLRLLWSLCWQRWLFFVTGWCVVPGLRGSWFLFVVWDRLVGNLVVVDGVWLFDMWVWGWVVLFNYVFWVIFLGFCR